jgi:hypothetical protein
MKQYSWLSVDTYVYTVESKNFPYFLSFLGKKDIFQVFDNVFLGRWRRKDGSGDEEQKRLEICFISIY